MPRTSKSWTAGDPGTAVEFNKIRDDFDELFGKGSDRLKVYKTAALTVTIGAGTYRVGGTEGQYAGGTVVVASAATTYIMIDTAGTIQTSTSAWNSNYARLAVVVSVAGNITTVTQWRNDVVGGVLGGLTFVDTQGSNTTPNDYNDSTFKAQLKTITNIGLNGIATGTYARLVGFRGQTSSTFGLSHETAYTDDGIYHRTGSTTTWGSWKKLGYKNDLTFAGATNQTASSGSPATTASVLLTKGGYVSATSSAWYNPSYTYTLTIQTSPDNSVWTNFLSNTSSVNTGFSERQYASCAISGFIPEGKYCRIRATGTFSQIYISGSFNQFT